MSWCLETLYNWQWLIRNFRWLVAFVLAADMCTVCYLAMYRPRTLGVLVNVQVRESHNDIGLTQRLHEQAFHHSPQSMDTSKSSRGLDYQSRLTAVESDHVISSSKTEDKNEHGYISSLNYRHAQITSPDSSMQTTAYRKPTYGSSPIFQLVTREKKQIPSQSVQENHKGLSPPPQATTDNKRKRNFVLIATSTDRHMKKWANVLDAFQPTVNYTEARLMKQILKTFVSAVNGANLTYFMYSGTLIGSYRHHGLIPWDDDIDVMMDYTQREQIKMILTSIKSIKHKYYLNTDNNWRWKFYSEASVPIKYVNWRWPSVDISFFKTNAESTKIEDSDPEFRRKFSYKISSVFPLVRRPFWNLMLYAPRDTLTVLVHSYSPNICLSNSYNHHHENRIMYTPVKLPCHKLWTYYPFVFRKNMGNYVNETLRLGHRIISWKGLPNQS